MDLNGLQAQINIIISYSREDEKSFRRFWQHLTALIDKKKPSIKSHLIEDTANIKNEIILEDIKSANIILILISPTYLHQYSLLDPVETSRKEAFRESYRRFIEDPDKNNDSRIIPIILKWTDLTGQFFETIESLPDDGKPITEQRDKDKAFLGIVNKIWEAVDKAEEKRQKNWRNLERYRKEYVEETKKQYPLSKEALDYLGKLKRELKLNQQGVIEIERPIRTKLEKEYNSRKIQYEQEFEKKRRQESPLTESSRKELTNLQTKLKLKKRDIEEIEKGVTAKIEAELITKSNLNQQFANNEKESQKKVMSQPQAATSPPLREKGSPRPPIFKEREREHVTFSTSNYA